MIHHRPVARVPIREDIHARFLQIVQRAIEREQAEWEIATEGGVRALTWLNHAKRTPEEMAAIRRKAATARRATLRRKARANGGQGILQN